MIRNNATPHKSTDNKSHPGCRIPDFFNHVTVTTGHARKSYLAEVGTDTNLRAHLEEALIAGSPVPGFPEFSAKAVSIDSHKVMVSLFHGKNLQVEFLVVDRNDSYSKEAYDLLVEKDFLGAVSREPSAPYCCASIAIPTISDPSSLLWIADYERCLSWEIFKRVSEEPFMFSSERFLPNRMISIGNEGPEIRETDYWTSELAVSGNAFLSWNAGTARLLLPERFVTQVADMRTADHVVISRGNHSYFGNDALEIMFDDGSDSPYCMHLARAHFDHHVDQSSTGPAAFTAWTRNGKVLSLPAWYRVVRQLPDLSPLKAAERSRLRAAGSSTAK